MPKWPLPFVVPGNGEAMSIEEEALFKLPDPLRFIAVTAADITEPDRCSVLATPIVEHGRVAYRLSVYPLAGGRYDIARHNSGNDKWWEHDGIRFADAQDAVDYIAERHT